MLLDQVREKARVKHFSIRTERCYIYWTQRYLRFLKGAGAWRHPAAAGTFRGGSFFDRPGRGRPSVGQHPESGARGAVVPLSRSPAKRHWSVGCGACTAAQTRAARVVERRSQAASGGAGRAADARAVRPDGATDVWGGLAAVGMLPAAGEGS